jgi:hypothetical protein
VIDLTQDLPATPTERPEDRNDAAGGRRAQGTMRQRGQPESSSPGDAALRALAKLLGRQPAAGRDRPTHLRRLRPGSLTPNDRQAVQPGWRAGVPEARHGARARSTATGSGARASSTTRPRPFQLIQLKWRRVLRPLGSCLLIPEDRSCDVPSCRTLPDPGGPRRCTASCSGGFALILQVRRMYFLT